MHKFWALPGASSSSLACPKRPFLGRSFLPSQPSQLTYPLCEPHTAAPPAVQHHLRWSSTESTLSHLSSTEVPCKRTHSFLNTTPNTSTLRSSAPLLYKSIIISCHMPVSPIDGATQRHKDWDPAPLFGFTVPASSSALAQSCLSTQAWRQESAGLSSNPGSATDNCGALSRSLLQHSVSCRIATIPTSQCSCRDWIVSSTWGAWHTESTQRTISKLRGEPALSV